MSLAIRKIQCSVARFLAYAKTQPPTAYAPYGRGQYTFGQLLLAHSIPQELKVVPVTVDADRLSNTAKALAMFTLTPLNRHADSIYTFEVPVRREQVLCPSPAEIEKNGKEFYAWNYRAALKWPSIQDEETGEAYYERCAKLVLLTSSLFHAGLSEERVNQVISTVTRWDRPWEVQAVLQPFLDDHHTALDSFREAKNT